MIRLFNQYISAKSIALIALECWISVCGLLLATKLRFWNEPEEFDAYTSVPEFLPQIASFVVVFQVCLYYSDFYNLRTIKRRLEQWFCLAQSLGAACVLLALLYYVLPGLLIGRGVFFTSMVVVAVSVMGSRLVLDTAWRLAAPTHNILILGTGELALKVAREIQYRDDLNMNVAGMLAVSYQNNEGAPRLSGVPVLGVTSDLAHIVIAHRISRIIVALEDRRGAFPHRDLVRLRVQGIQVDDAHTTISSLTGRVWLEAVQPDWFIFSNGFRRSRLTVASKRALDLMFSTVGLVLSSPIMVVVALLIRLDSKGPIIYRQVRVGYRGRNFEVLKFRSMRVDAEAATGAQWALQDDPRVTRIGKVLRKYRIDELPQFWNIIRGDMSFVGPRPERPVFVEQLRHHIPYYDERHLVRPGLTGWAQVQYQYGSSTEDALRKLEYDLFYLMNMSVIFDCAIAVHTIRVLLSARGAR